MKIKVKVHPKSKHEKVVKISKDEFDVYFNIPPEKGRANRKLIEMLAEHFQVSLDGVTIILGATGKNKLIEVNNDTKEI